MKRIQHVVRSLTNARFAAAAALLAVLAATGYWGGKLLFVRVYAQGTINVRPYVMEYDSISVHDGVEKIIDRTTESRRHDGALHYIGTHYGQSPKQQDATFRRVDLPDSTTALISDAAHAKSTARKPQADVARQIAETFFSRVGPDCTEKGVINETVEGTDTLFGYSAVRISTLQGKDKAARDAGLAREVEWRLPEFNCVIAQSFLQTHASKAEEWKTTLGNRLTAIAATEPDPALFTNWLSYDEMKPSDIGRKLATMQGLTPETCPRCFAPDPSDKNYAKWHKGEN
jgi:hypothetical protein